MTTILIKKKDTAGAPAPGDLTNAAGGTEIAVNTATKRIYTKDSSGTVVELGTNATSSTVADLTVTSSTTLSYGTANQVQYLNGSKLLVGSADLTWDGTTLSAVGRLYNGSASTFGASTWGMSLGNGGVSANYFKASTTYWQNDSGTQISQLNSTGLAIGASGAVTSFTALGSTSTSLGLSITASGWNNARHRLTVPTSGDSSVWSFNYSGSAVDFASYGTSAISVGSATITFGIGNTNTAPSELGRFTTTGLGLGTTTPYASLHVTGTGSLFSGAPPALSATDPLYSGLAVGFSGVDNAAQLIATNPSGAALAFYTKSGAGSAPAQRMSITSAGLVGVGTTSPLTALQVNSGSLYVLGVKSTTTYGFISLQDGGTSGTLTDGTVAVGANVDDLVFRSGGANRARLGGTGNFGLGVTATAWLWPDSSTGVLQLQAGAAFSGYNAGAVVSQNWYYNAGEKFIGNGYASRYSQASGIHAWSVSSASNSSGAGAALTWSESMRITTAGKVAIGSTTGPQGRVSIWGSAASAIELSFDTTATYGDIQTYGSTPLFIQRQGNDLILNNGGGGTVIGNSSTRSGLLTLKNTNPATNLIAIQNYGSTGTIGTVSFDQGTDVWSFANQTTNGAIAFGAGSGGPERMRITAGGDGIFMFKSAGSVTTNGWQFTSTGGGMVFTQTNNEFFAWNNYNGSGTVQMDFRWNNSEVGAINMTASGVAYTTASDARLKKNIVDAQDAGAIIDALRIREYDMIVDDRHVRFGLVYQEAAEIFPEGGHMPEGKYGMVDKTEYVPLLIKEIQSLRKRLADAGIA